MIRCTRLAPSPTGALHLGNARTFLINWALARRLGWRIVLRIDDLDGPRVKQGAAQQAEDDLRWLGLEWDAGPIQQTQHAEHYQQALSRLAEERLIYPCYCTRSQIQAASHSAPQEGAKELHYPGTCRPVTDASCRRRDQVIQATRWLQPGDAGWRIVVPDGEISLVDRIAGSLRYDVQRQVGDFLVATKTGWPSYQLAVVVDDHQQGVTDVVRGDDLLDSTPRQVFLHRCLSLPEPCYWHLPIVVGEDGRRLAKRHGDTRLSHYRELGVAPERILALLGDWSGLGRHSALSARDFLEQFDWRRTPRDRITMTAADDAWLRGA